MEEIMLGLSGEESGLFHIPSKDEKTVNMTEISMKELFNLPKPSTEEMKWNPKSNPCIAVLCKDEKDVNRMCELYNDEGNNQFVYVINRFNLLGQNPIAIFVSKKFENEDNLLDIAIKRVISRCGSHADFKQVFVAMEK
jgi:hypothetical protein